MAEQKPKKDLRARLGRTITPQTPGAPAAAGITPPVVAPAAAPAAAPPATAAAEAKPAATAEAPKAAPAVTPPPAVVAPPVIAPPIAAPVAGKMPFGPDIAPPPFAKPAEPAKPEPKKKADPFAAAAVQQQQEVRIQVDNKPVDDAEVGKRQTGRIFLVIAAGLVVGAMLGAGVGTMNGRRRLYNTTVTDGHAIFAAVDGASRNLLEAQTHVEALATAAGGGPTGHPSVAYDEITALTGMANPLPASAFSNRNYNAFQPGTVDDLFTYYNNIQELWRQFHRLSDIANGPADRPSVDEFAAVAVCPVALHHSQESAHAAIQAAADATATAAQAQYVALLTSGADGVHGSLRFAEPELDASGNPTGHILARSAPGETPANVELWTPDTAITAEATHAVVINGANSAGVLGERLGSFRTYVQALTETRTLMTTTIEVQGRLTTALGDIAALQEVTAF